MLTAAEVERLAINLSRLNLAPVMYFSIVAAITGALVDETPSRHQEVSPANGATPPQDAKRSASPTRPAFKPGEALARARQVLAENPGLGTAGLARAAGVGIATAKRALVAARKQAAPAAIQLDTTLPAPDQPGSAWQRADRGQLAALNMLRGALSRGPKPASHIEEMANTKGICINQLEDAKEQMGIRCERLDNGRGVCYLSPEYQAETDTEDNTNSDAVDFEDAAEEIIRASEAHEG